MITQKDKQEQNDNLHRLVSTLLGVNDDVVPVRLDKPSKTKISMNHYEVHAIPLKRKKISKLHSINTFEEFNKRNKVSKFSDEDDAINFAYANNKIRILFPLWWGKV